MLIILKFTSSGSASQLSCKPESCYLVDLTSGTIIEPGAMEGNIRLEARELALIPPVPVILDKSLQLSLFPPVYKMGIIM